MILRYIIRTGFLLILFSVIILSPAISGDIANRSNNKIKNYSYKVDRVLRHDPTAYTQGLFFEKGVLYESTGQYGQSSFRKVDLETGAVLQRVNFDSKYFIEGSCVLNGMLYVLTWMENVCLVYDINSLQQVGQLRNPREGWGLTTDGKDLIMSDGTTMIYFLDPNTFFDKRSIEVKRDGKPITYINELEYIDGKIWANVYLSEEILIINPSTGVVEGVIDFAGIYPMSERPAKADVFNGIAYNPITKKIYVTGKLWTKIFEVSIR